MHEIDPAPFRIHARRHRGAPHGHHRLCRRSQPHHLEADQGRHHAFTRQRDGYANEPYTYSLNLKAGKYVLVARATGVNGSANPANNANCQLDAGDGVNGEYSYMYIGPAYNNNASEQSITLVSPANLEQDGTATITCQGAGVGFGRFSIAAIEVANVASVRD